ncbi:MAG TPA: hypothetical protein VLR45_03920 [Desulfoprunum sp.]|nr:hypothetical protein [Desulfoprunum sp.]
MSTGIESITVEWGARIITDCSSIILVPEIAMTEPGYIRTMTLRASAHAKHEFHTMAQMAYYQFQDGELEITPLESSLRVSMRGDVEELVAGLALYRDTEGRFHALMHEGQDGKRLIEAAYRFCTRWIRLDI